MIPPKLAGIGYLGIGIVVPGERYDDRAQPMLDYFLAFEKAFNLFPGFEFEVPRHTANACHHGSTTRSGMPTRVRCPAPFRPCLQRCPHPSPGELPATTGP
jgi:hypothetical protein